MLKFTYPNRWISTNPSPKGLTRTQPTSHSSQHISGSSSGTGFFQFVIDGFRNWKILIPTAVEKLYPQRACTGSVNRRPKQRTGVVSIFNAVCKNPSGNHVKCQKTFHILLSLSSIISAMKTQIHDSINAVQKPSPLTNASIKQIQNETHPGHNLLVNVLTISKLWRGDLHAIKLAKAAEKNNNINVCNMNL
jgi:hypothetical protein